MTHHSKTAVENVLDAIATAENVDPVSMTPPLATAIDPDALNEFVDHGSHHPERELEVRFTYRGHDVAVSECGDVELG